MGFKSSYTSKITPVLVWWAFHFLPVQADASVFKSIASGLEISGDCRVAYDEGFTKITTYIQDGFSLRSPSEYAPVFDQWYEQALHFEECQFAFSLGMLDAFQSVQQITTLESWLELDWLKDQHHLSTKARQTLNSIIMRRLELVGLSGEEILQASSTPAAQEYIASVTSQFHRMADSEHRLVSIGRFAFIGGQAPVHTTFDYAVDARGELIVSRGSEVQVAPGSLQRAASSLWERAKRDTEAYLSYRPSLYFGEDSFLYGAFWRAIGWDDSKSIREIREESFLETLRKYISTASALRIDAEPFRKLYNLALKKQRIQLQNEIEAFDATITGLYFAPLIPVGMHIGGALLAKTAWFAAVPAGTTSGSLVGGSLSYGANAAAAFSLTALVGVQLQHQIVAHGNSIGTSHAFTFYDRMDTVLRAAFEAFPTAAILPVEIGMAALGAKHAYMSGRWLLTQSASLAGTAKSLGVGGSAQAIGQMLWRLPGQTVRLPGILVRSVIASWWQQPKILAIHYATDIVLGLTYEIGYRQFFLDGESKFFYRDSAGQTHYNKQALYSIAATVIINPLSKPVMFINSFAGRWFAYRGVTLVTSVLSQLAISGEIDEKRLLFDQVYFATVGTALGEVDRSVKLSQYVINQPASRQLALLLLFKAFLLRPTEQPIRIYLQDRYVAGNAHPIEDLRDLVAQHSPFDISDFTDAEIEASLNQLGLDYTNISKTLAADEIP